MSTVAVVEVYDCFNLNIFHALIPPFCLTNHLSTLQAFALNYVIAFYRLVVIVFMSVFDCMLVILGLSFTVGSLS